MTTVLKEVVTLGGLALQMEDCLIRAAVWQRGLTGGLAHLENERHHQFIVWRAILSRWDAKLERDEASDLIVHCQDGLHHFEMKNWRGATGNPQLPSMQRDIEKLRRRDRGYLMVTSMNPPEKTDENFKYLVERVIGLDADTRQEFRFLTEGVDGRRLDFWIAGWALKREIPVS